MSCCRLMQMAELQDQIEAVGKESQRQIELADKRKMLKSELRRLEDENSMQRDRISQMEHDLKVRYQHCVSRGRNKYRGTEPVRKFSILDLIQK